MQRFFRVNAHKFLVISLILLGILLRPASARAEGQGLCGKIARWAIPLGAVAGLAAFAILQGDDDEIIPVKLARGKKKPKITFYPERHDDEECLEVVEENRAIAKAGRCLLGEEGRLLPSQEGILGIEEPATRLLTTALINLGKFNDPSFKKSKGTGFLKELTDVPEFSRPIWEKTKARIIQTVGNIGDAQKTDMLEHFRLVDELYGLKTEKEREAFLKTHRRKLGVFGTALPILTLPALMEAQSAEARERFPALKVLDGVRHEEDIDTPEETAALWNVVIEMRDESFAKTLLKHYEAEVAGEGRELRIRLGARHLAGVYRRVRKSLDAAAGGEEVAIEADERFLEFAKIKSLERYPALKEEVFRINRYEKQRRAP